MDSSDEQLGNSTGRYVSGQISASPLRKESTRTIIGPTEGSFKRLNAFVSYISRGPCSTRWRCDLPPHSQQSSVKTRIFACMWTAVRQIALPHESCSPFHMKDRLRGMYSALWLPISLLAQVSECHRVVFCRERGVHSMGTGEALHVRTLPLETKLLSKLADIMETDSSSGQTVATAVGITNKTRHSQRR